MTLKQYNSNFITYEISPGVYSIKDGITELLLRGFKSEFEIRDKMWPNVKCDRLDPTTIEYDDIDMRTELIVRVDVLALKFDQKPFLVLS